jgi:hypothetical protein
MWRSHPLVLRRSPYAKVPLTPIYPWQGIVVVVILWEIQLVGGGQEVISWIGVLFCSGAGAAAELVVRRPIPFVPECVFDTHSHFLCHTNSSMAARR